MGSNPILSATFTGSLEMKGSRFFVIFSTPQKPSETRTESLLAGRFLKFSEGRTSGEAALPAHNEEREAFQVLGC